jgi:hypothetical protein
VNANSVFIVNDDLVVVVSCRSRSCRSSGHATMVVASGDCEGGPTTVIAAPSRGYVRSGSGIAILDGRRERQRTRATFRRMMTSSTNAHGATHR